MKQHIQYQINTVACDISVAEVPSQPSNCPSTIEILGIQLQDVAIDTDLGRAGFSGIKTIKTGSFPKLSPDPTPLGFRTPKEAQGARWM